MRDKRSLEFTVTRSFVELFRTGSAAVVDECQKFFRFLPVTYQIDIRMAKFLQKFMINENSICRLFVKQAGTNLKKFFSSYYGNVKSVYEMRIAAENMYFGCQ